MRRTLSWLVAGTLVAGMGGASMATSQDSFIPIQDPPELSMGNLYQYFGTSDTSNAIDRIFPTATSASVREGFSANADVNDVDADSPAAFDYNLTTEEQFSNDAARVPEGGDIANSAPYYRMSVDVTTNGPVKSIERVGLCLLNTNDYDVKADGSVDGTFDWYDSTDGNSTNDTNDVERNCGFSDEDPTTDGQVASARAGLAIIYDYGNDNFTLNDSSTDHEVVLASSRGTNRSGTDLEEGSFAEVTTNSENADSSGTLRVHFAFKPSHALAKGSSGWVIRAAAQDKPADVPLEDGTTESFAPQKSELFYGHDPDTYLVEGELRHADNSELTDFESNWNEIAVSYYGAIVSEREGIDYGTLAKGDSKVSTTTAGRYIANNASKLYIQATNFQDAAGDTLNLHNLESNIEERQVVLSCNYDDEIGTADGLAQKVAVLETPKLLLDGDDSSIPASTGALTSSADSPEAIKDVHDQEGGSTGMSCELLYGGGATNASQEYTNTVTISIADVDSLF